MGLISLKNFTTRNIVSSNDNFSQKFVGNCIFDVFPIEVKSLKNAGRKQNMFQLVKRWSDKFLTTFSDQFLTKYGLSDFFYNSDDFLTKVLTSYSNRKKKVEEVRRFLSSNIKRKEVFFHKKKKNFFDNNNNKNCGCRKSLKKKNSSTKCTSQRLYLIAGSN